jgi:phosphinothricin acetyltransferase
MTWRIRRARASDMAAIAEIINHYIADGVAHFGDRPQTAEEWTADWETYQERYPWLVAERDGVVAGLAYAKTFNPRAAYRWTAEISIYLRDSYRGQGLGTALYRRLLEVLDAQGYRCLIAGITTPNEGSVALHESFGFRYLGTIERAGYKFGAWHDVGSWQRLSGHLDDAEPAPIRPVSEVW